MKVQEWTNRFTGKKVSEAIDDARDEIITDLLETATAFIEQGHTYYSRNGNGLPVKDAIFTNWQSNCTQTLTLSHTSPNQGSSSDE